MHRVLLLNPPASDRVIREYYCSKTTRSSYLLHPIDLILQSGLLAEHFDVVALDAVAEELTVDEARRRIARLRPDAVLAQVGAVCLEDDLAFLGALGLPTVITGDVVLERPDDIVADHPFLLGVLRDLTATDAVDLFLGQSLRPVPLRTWRVPRPRHELFRIGDYQLGLLRRTPFATVLTDFGCRWSCSFCVMGSLDFKVRPLDDVDEELSRLAADGVRDVFFLDQTFGADRQRGRALAAITGRLGLGFAAFTRADLLDADVLDAWQAGGLQTLILGVEFADPAQHRRTGKGKAHAHVETALRLCQERGIRTVGTFVLGLPEDDETSIRATIDLATSLPLDFASFNVAVPRAATGLRARAVEEGLVDSDLRQMDQAGAYGVLPTRSLTAEQVVALKVEAVRRFYLRPGWLARRALDARSGAELWRQAREGMALLGRNR